MLTNRQGERVLSLFTFGFRNAAAARKNNHNPAGDRPAIGRTQHPFSLFGMTRKRREQQLTRSVRIDTSQNTRKYIFDAARIVPNLFTHRGSILLKMDDNSLRTTAFTIEKLNDGWFVVLPDKSMLGPYLNGDIVLEVAVTHALLARSEGLDAHIFVRDEKGGSHSCIILDYMNDPHRCQKCESSWSSSGLPLKCQLRAAIGRF